MTEMHDVVEMILNRMKDYPEDFVTVQSAMVYRETNKWERALRLVYEVADQHEKDALDIRTQEAKRAVYMGAALKTILSDEEPEEEKLTISTANRYATSIGQSMLNTKNTVANSIMLGSAQLTEDKVNMITELQARQKAMEAQLAADKHAIRQEYEKAYATNHA